MKNITTFLLMLLATMSMTSTAGNINRSKLSPMLLEQINGRTPSTSTQLSAAKSEISNNIKLTLSLVKVSDELGVQSLRDHGCLVLDHVGDIYFALLPSNQLAALSLDEHIMQMEANAPASLCMDSTEYAINTSPAYAGIDLPQAYTGKGVLVGICDTGFDFTHPMFLDAANQSRIKAAWDIYGLLGNGPYGIGSLYNTSDELLQAKGTVDSSYVEKDATYYQYHGTHVAAIAAGSTFHCDSTGKDYHGIAYEADILETEAYTKETTSTEMRNRLNAALKTAMDVNPSDSIFAGYKSAELTASNVVALLSAKYMFDYASSHNQPIVTNMSFGAQENYYSDTRLAEELLNRMIGPGRIIVASSGNYSDEKLYSHKEQNQIQQDTLYFSNKELAPNFSLRNSGDFKLVLYPIGMQTSDTLTINEADFHNLNYLNKVHVDTLKATNNLGNQYTAYVSARFYQYDTNDMRYLITVEGDDSLCTNVSYALTMEGKTSMDFLGASSCTLGTGKNFPYTLHFPSSAKNIISVGLTDHRYRIVNIYGKGRTNNNNTNEYGDVVSWSGCGPSLTGYTKPDILAPGYNIYSAINSNCGGYIQNQVATIKNKLTGISKYNGKDYYLTVASGSSQSSPAVAGTIALWLQANPQLTPDGIREVFSATAKHINPNITYPNNVYGYGEIDSYAGLLKVLNMTDIKGLSMRQPSALSFQLNGKTLSISGTTKATVCIYATDGRVISKQQFAGGSISLSELPSGVYAVQVTTGNSATTGSTLIRL